MWSSWIRWWSSRRNGHWLVSRALVALPSFRLSSEPHTDTPSSDSCIYWLSSGLPPVMNFGSDDLKKEIIEPVLAGEKFICLAISEAFAGSDVMGMKTTAKKTEDGKHYIVNGTKVSSNSGLWFATLTSLSSNIRWPCLSISHLLSPFLSPCSPSSSPPSPLFFNRNGSPTECGLITSPLVSRLTMDSLSFVSLVWRESRPVKSRLVFPSFFLRSTRFILS